MSKKRTYLVHTTVTFTRTRWIEASSKKEALKSWKKDECESTEIDRDDCVESEELDCVEEGGI